MSNRSAAEATAPFQFTKLPSLSLKRIVMITPDLSTIGGIQLRTRKVLRSASGRDVEYVGLSIKNENDADFPENIFYRKDREDIRHLVSLWSPRDTVFLVPNNTLKLLPPAARAEVDKFPLIFNGSGQLSYMIQDSSILSDIEYTEQLRVSKIVVFSNMDRNVYNQFGIYDVEVGFHPTEVRELNGYDPVRNRYVTYVGRIDFFAKAAERLLNAIVALRNLRRGPLRIYTTGNPKNSPQIGDFLELLETHSLQDDVELIYDEVDPEKLYREASLLLLPSKKDSFPNVILEANSFGVPVVAMSYAPGPSEIVIDGKTGFLIDDFSIENLRYIFSSSDAKTMSALSKQAFERHKLFSMERYFDFIERVGDEAVQSFSGTNLTPVYPQLKPLTTLHGKLVKATTEVERLKASERKLRQRELELTRDLNNWQSKYEGVQKVLADTREQFVRKRDVDSSPELTKLRDEIAMLERKRQTSAR